MGQAEIIAPKFFFERVECFFRYALSAYNPECPIRDFLATGEPFIRPRKKNSSGKTAFYDAVDMPTQHFGLFILRMPDRVHAEFPQDKRMLASEILQPQQVTLEIRLVVKINIKTRKIVILRQQVFGWRISGIVKEGIRINRASEPNQFLHEFNHATRPEPARHCAGDLVANQVTEYCWMPGVCAHGGTHSFGNLFAHRSFV